mgnify:CR=1 FL=1
MDAKSIENFLETLQKLYHHKNDKLPSYIRNHWGIENKLHWVLDVHLKEDDDQKAERKSVRSFAILKRITFMYKRHKQTHIILTYKAL